LPFLNNPHLQTVLGAFWSSARPLRRASTTYVSLPDGDALAVHLATPRLWRTGDPIAILVHGLGGCHQSPYVIRVANRLLKRGIAVAAVDLRGAGAGAGHATRIYNAGCSDDIWAVADLCTRAHPASPLALVGFSLGGNIVLKLAGDPHRPPLPRLECVAAYAPPIDLTRCADLIAGLPFYDRFFVRHLTAQVQRQQELNPRLPPVAFPNRLTLRGFDDFYTAPRGGFVDAADYYRRASCYPLLDNIRVPTLLLTARDDPFICVTPFERVRARPGLEVHISATGGHLGFLGYDGAVGVRWAERFVVEWIDARLLRSRAEFG